MTIVTLWILLTLAHSRAPLGQGANAQSQQPQPSAQAPEHNKALKLQVMLDRAGFSPGPIDGRMGSNTKKALELFQKSGNQASSDVEATTRYLITEEDAAGPFIERLPHDMMETAKLPELRYTSLVEALAERFHSTPAFLQLLNPGVTLAAGQEIQVPNVEPMALPQSTASTPRGIRQSAAGGVRNPAQPAGTSGTTAETPPQKPDVTVTIAKTTSSLTVTDASGRVLLYAPVTTGSVHDPLPIGEWNVTGIQFNPTFRYNPELFWDADPTHTKATIHSGPNNPVGLVWIGISKEHYGLHGTPEPATIGRTESHGCVRLTNWDALKVAALVKPGTSVVFTE